MDLTFLTAHTKMPRSSILPDALESVPISSTSKLVYMKLLRKTLDDGVPDENGIYFVRYPQDEMSIDIGKSMMTVKRCLRDLELVGLIMRVHEGVGKPALIYVLIPRED